MAVLTTRQISEKYQVGRQTVLDWIANGVQVNGARHVLQAQRIGKQFRVEQSALDQFVRALNQKKPTTGERAVSAGASPVSEGRVSSARRRGRGSLERALSRK